MAATKRIARNHRTLTPAEKREIRDRLSRPVGRYDAERASQLSGIPERTVRFWGETGVVVADYGKSAPMHWSYRDLVLLRLAAWLRSKKMEPKWVGARIAAVREWLGNPKSNLELVRSQGRSMVVGDEALDRVSGELIFSPASRRRVGSTSGDHTFSGRQRAFR